MRDGSKLKLARCLRKDMTDAERKLWHRLRQEQLGFKFRRQHPIGSYVADFACLDPAVIVELDGGQHLESTSDALRDAWLRNHGFRVLRYWNNDVLERIENVLEDIARALVVERPDPSLPPQAGEGAET